MRRVRALRIGYRPVEAQIPPATDGIAKVDLTMKAVALMLDRVQVDANRECPRRVDGEAAFALWQQARAGLLATIVAREARPAAMLDLQYERDLSGFGERVEGQRVRITTIDGGTTAFRAARPASQFVQTGFATDSGGSHILFDPDAEVLLDDAFTSGYCFSIADPDLSRPREVGLEFRPAKRDTRRVDISGVLWVDTAVRALKEIEYRHLGLGPAVDRLRPGGRVSFREMPNGAVVIDRWSMRMVNEDTTAKLGAMRVTGRYAVTEGGGELARARWPDGSEWHASLGTLRVHVRDQRGQAAVGAVLRLDSTDYLGQADSSGMLDIGDLLPGPYSAVVIDSALDAIGVRLPTNLTFVAARDSLVEKTLVLPAATDTVKRRCQMSGAYSDGSLFVIARAVNPDGTPLRGARWNIRGRSLVTSDDGVFAYCTGIAPGNGAAVEISVWRDHAGRGNPSAVATVVPKDKITAVRIVVPELKSP